MRNIYLVFVLCILASVLLISTSSETYSRMDVPIQSRDVEKDNEIMVEPTETEPIKIIIGAVGDIMTHGPQLRAQYNVTQNTYDFNNNYQHVEKYIKQCHLALCNIETVFAGKDRKYSSYPRFNTPDTLIDALYACGFQIGITSNNHCLDRGKEGILKTLQVIENKGMIPVGTQLPKQQNYKIVEVEQIKIGIAAFTYETQKYNNNKTINGIVVPQEIEDTINTFNYDNLDQDLIKMDTIIENMNDSGTQIKIFYLHWGQEYTRKQNHLQEKIAKHLAQKGIDIIFGSHPHVIQPVEIIKTEDGHETTVFYSLGNFISNQRYELMNNRYTEDGIIAQVEYEINPDNNSSNLQKISMIPTWVNRYYKNHKRNYEILPLTQSTLQDITDQQTMWRIKNSLKNTTEIIGQEYLDEETGQFILLDREGIGE